VSEDYGEILDLVIAIVSLFATAGFFLLLPLYFSQRRDVMRLREWMERQPDHPAADLEASEAILDRAESEIEQLTGESEAIAATAVQAPGEAAGAAHRVTSERPALERVTMERAALQPHPRWRRFVATATQPQWLAVIGAGAVILGILVVFGSDRLLETFDDERGPRVGAVVPEDVTVSVLNGTSVPGLAAKVGDDVEANGFELAEIGTSDPVDSTVVLFAEGQEKEAKRVAKQLGRVRVRAIDAATAREAGDVDVVVIAGEDRAGS
jgi:LytR cell envelope-related transcriptional attenuator